MARNEKARQKSLQRHLAKRNQEKRALAHSGQSRLPASTLVPRAAVT